MEVRITSRHSTLPESLRDRTEESLSKLNKYGARISAVEVIFDEEKTPIKSKEFCTSTDVTRSWRPGPGMTSTKLLAK